MATQVLVVTDYTGNLHVTPFNNKSYYLSRNLLMRNKPNQQYKIQEFDSEEAANGFISKNNGMDPKYVAPADIQQELSLKDKEIADLRKKLEDLQKPTVATVVEQVKASQSAEEVQQIAGQYEDAEIAKAAQARIKELSKTSK